MTSNVAPKCKWQGIELACGTRRQWLFVDGRKTSFFIDSAKGVLAHRTQGDEHGLFGAGMAPSISGRRIAAMLGSGGNIAALKHCAEQMAMSPRAALTQEPQI